MSAITALPTPPSTSSPSTFSAQADAFIAALPTLVTQINALAVSLGFSSTAYLGPNSSNPTVDNLGNALTVGTIYFNTAVPELRVYNGTAWTSLPSGTYLPISGGTLTGPLTAPSLSVTGPVNEAHGADIASASTINLTTATGNVVDVTGTNAITAITLAEGYQRTVRFTGALTLTNGASLVLPGGANITTASGDYAVFRGYAGGVVRCTSYSPIAPSIADARYGNGVYPFTAAQASNILTGTLAACPTTYNNATLTTGTPVTFSTTSSLTLAIPATSNLGMLLTAQSNRLYWLEAYNAGSPVLCVVNAAGGVNLDEATLISPTTIGASSNSASTIYSASAVAANSPFRVVGFTDVVFTTGTGWSSPTVVRPAGGTALAAMASIGYGQTWQAFTVGTQRVVGTTYYNLTGKPITVSAISGSSTSGGVAIIVNGVTAAAGFDNTGQVQCFATAIVPAGASYSITVNGSSGSITTWRELR